MLDEGQIAEIVQSINEEALRIKFGKIFIELNVVDSEVVDMDIETKRKKRIPKVALTSIVIHR